MFGDPSVCHPLSVNSVLRTLVVSAALFALPATVQATRFVTPIVSTSEPAPIAPQVSVNIPEYQLTRQDRDTIAACLILEAASQGDYGMRAVMAVIRNRARNLPELFAPTVLRPKQFSAFNTATGGREPLANLINRAKRDIMWFTAISIVEEATGPEWHDPTGGATHYTRSAERTQWTRSLAKTVTIGAHSFYR